MREILTHGTSLFIDDTMELSSYLICIACGFVVIVITFIYWCYKRRSWKRLQYRLNYIQQHFHHIVNEYTLPTTLDKDCLKKHGDLLLWSDDKLNDEENKIIGRKLLSFRNKYTQGYDSFIKQNPGLTYSELYQMRNEIVNEDNFIKEHKRKAEHERKKQQIKNQLNKLVKATEIGDVDKAKDSINLLDKEIACYGDEEVKKAINIAKERFDSKYEEGFSDKFELSYVYYDIPKQFVQGEDWKYVVTKFPAKGTVVFPFRRNRIERRGYMEESFQFELSRNLSKYKLQIIGDCGILPKDDSHPYEPDIAVIDLENPSIRIDIEIDEPYAAISNKPTHYIGCGDDIRDMRLNNMGWIVVRFTEYQVLSEMNACINFIALLIHKLNPAKLFPDVLLQSTLPTNHKRWTEIESKLMAIDRYRQKYLCHEFGHIDEVKLENKDIKQTDKEKKCSRLVKPLIIPTDKKVKLANDTNVLLARDRKIQFYPQEHIYLFDGDDELTPVSSIVSCLFNPFDSDYWSKRKANQRCVPQGQVLEEWDATSCLSREVGTFMHLQIQNYYKGLSYQTLYHFKYAGKYIKIDKQVRLNREQSHFMSFVNEHQFIPFRTEWSVYDEDIKIAGTIDMLHYRDGFFDIYDWKRSNKVLDSSGNPIVHNGYGQTGKDKYRNIQDTPYWHYCLQQNLYRYILQTKYNIRVGKMYLVVYSEIQNSYKKLEVPYMDDVIAMVINDCKNGTLTGMS